MKNTKAAIVLQLREEQLSDFTCPSTRYTHG